MKCFACGIGNNDNSRTKCLCDLNFFSVFKWAQCHSFGTQQRYNTLYSEIFIFWPIYGHGRGPYGLWDIFPTWNFFWGRPSRRAKLAVIWLLKPQILIFCHESFFIWWVVLRYTTYAMERSIGCKMAELEPIKGYNWTKTAISQNQFFWKFWNAKAIFS